MPHVVSANRLTDGIVVFRAAEDAWSEKLNDAELLADPAAAKAALEAAQADIAGNRVVDAYAFEVTGSPGRVQAKHIRDRIRASGPTIRFDTGAQQR